MYFQFKFSSIHIIPFYLVFCFLFFMSLGHFCGMTEGESILKQSVHSLCCVCVLVLVVVLPNRSLMTRLFSNRKKDWIYLITILWMKNKKLKTRIHRSRLLCWKRLGVMRLFHFVHGCVFNDFYMRLATASFIGRLTLMTMTASYWHNKPFSFLLCQYLNSIENHRIELMDGKT